MIQYGTDTQVNNAGDVPRVPVSADNRVRAEIGSETFTGRVLGSGYDGEPVVYVEDRAGHERAIRLRREWHALELVDRGETV